MNPVDAKARAGELPQMFPAERLPLLLGFDASGRIEEVGTGVTDWKIGDAVYGFPGADPGTSMVFSRGTFAEYVCLRTDEVAAAPQSLSARRCRGDSTGGNDGLAWSDDTGAKCSAVSAC